MSTRKPKIPVMQQPAITRFSGIETKVKPTDQRRGTLRQADGVNTIPIGALTMGPNWQTAWAQSTLGTAITSALTGASGSETHFVTVSALDLSGNTSTFLVAWDLANGRSRGMWHVVGSVDPFTGNPSPSVTIAAPNNAIYRGYTAGLNFYGSFINGTLWIGNGTDQNLMWGAGALSILAATVTNPQDPSQVNWPPCKSWAQADWGAIFGSGNVTFPLRAWTSEIPNLTFPSPTGLKTANYSWKDIQTLATAITAVSVQGSRVIVHLNTEGPNLILRDNESQGGWKFDQQPMSANASAINPGCTRDIDISPIYLGTDLEMYAPKQTTGYDLSKWRDADIVTGTASGQWNKQATKPFAGDDYAIIYDEKNGRLWALLQMSASSRQGVYCYDERSPGITGPWNYPDILSICQTQDRNDSTIVCGITRDGVWLWADLQVAGNVAPLAPGTALPVECGRLGSAPTPSAGIPYVAVDEVNNVFSQTLNGQTLVWANAWTSPPVAGGSITPTVWFTNARLSIVELSSEDLGLPDLNKTLEYVRMTLRKNSCLYAGVYVELDGNRYGQFQANALYPDEQWIFPANGMAGKFNIRIVMVSFNDQAAAVSSVTPNFYMGTPD